MSPLLFLLLLCAEGIGISVRGRTLLAFFNSDLILLEVKSRAREQDKALKDTLF